MTTDYQAGVRALLCTEKGGIERDIDPNGIDRFIAAQGNLLWLDIDTAVTRDLGLLKREFGFHDLALEDALRPHQRAKVDSYDGYTFIIFYGATLRRSVLRPNAVERGEPPRAPDQDGGELIRLHQLALFVSTNYMVTVHHGPLRELDEVAKRWHENIQQIDHSIGSLVYSLLDTIVDDYFPVIDQIADLVDEVEESVFSHFDEGALQEIFALKKALLNMRRVVAPERDVMNVLIRRDAPVFGESSLIYFQDIYDHVARVADSLDIYRDLLSSALDAYLSMASNRLNEVMKTLTSWSLPLMAGALMAGIWGMNFRHMPELGYRFGYLFGVLSIIAVMAGIAAFFRHRRWL